MVGRLTVAVEDVERIQHHWGGRWAGDDERWDNLSRASTLGDGRRRPRSWKDGKMERCEASPRHTWGRVASYSYSYSYPQVERDGGADDVGPSQEAAQRIGTEHLVRPAAVLLLTAARSRNWASRC